MIYLIELMLLYEICLYSRNLMSTSKSVSTLKASFVLVSYYALLRYEGADNSVLYRPNTDGKSERKFERIIRE